MFSSIFCPYSSVAIYTNTLAAVNHSKPLQDFAGLVEQYLTFFEDYPQSEKIPANLHEFRQQNPGFLKWFQTAQPALFSGKVQYEVRFLYQQKEYSLTCGTDPADTMQVRDLSEPNRAHFEPIFKNFGMLQLWLPVQQVKQYLEFFQDHQPNANLPANLHEFKQQNPDFLQQFRQAQPVSIAGKEQYEVHFYYQGKEYSITCGTDPADTMEVRDLTLADRAHFSAQLLENFVIVQQRLRAQQDSYIKQKAYAQYYSKQNPPKIQQPATAGTANPVAQHSTNSARPNLAQASREFTVRARSDSQLSTFEQAWKADEVTESSL